MDKEYNMFRYFKGEKENPYKEGSLSHHFWFYESVFQSDFEQRSSSDWRSFFSGYGLEKEFMTLLSERDYSIPSDKKGIFSLWLKYLFGEKLPKSDQALYYSNTDKI